MGGNYKHFYTILGTSVYFFGIYSYKRQVFMHNGFYIHICGHILIILKPSVLQTSYMSDLGSLWSASRGHSQLATKTGRQNETLSVVSIGYRSELINFQFLTQKNYVMWQYEKKLLPYFFLNYVVTNLFY